jgi:hypothetical protein
MSHLAVSWSSVDPFEPLEEVMEQQLADIKTPEALFWSSRDAAGGSSLDEDAFGVLAGAEAPLPRGGSGQQLQVPGGSARELPRLLGGAHAAAAPRKAAAPAAKPSTPARQVRKLSLADCTLVGAKASKVQPPAPTEEAPSRGSEKHGQGKCQPCAWFWKSGGCFNNQDCGYCHLCPEGEIKHRKKSKVSLMRMGALVPAAQAASQGSEAAASRVLKISVLLSPEAEAPAPTLPGATSSP